jgi:hypothetical protein
MSGATAERPEGRSKGGLAGLRNLGNTCYFNSALQCLLHLEPIISLFSTPEEVPPLPNPAANTMIACEHEYLPGSNIRVAVASYFSLMLDRVWNEQRDVYILDFLCLFILFIIYFFYLSIYLFILCRFFIHSSLFLLI